MDDTQALQLAREALRQGNKAAARTLLVQIVKRSPRSEAGWLLLSAAVDDPIKEQDCLKRVLAINPGSDVARRHLDRLAQASAPPEQTASPELTPEPIPPSQVPCPYCGNLIRESVTFCGYCARNIRTGLLPQAALTLPLASEQKPATPQPTIPPKSQQKKHSALWIIGIIVLVGVLGCCGLLFLGALGSSPGGSQRATSTPLKVEYRVSGTARSADLTFANADGGTQQYAPMPVPYTIPLFNPHYGQFAYISAQNNTEDGTITCEILVNGKVWKHSTSAGEYAIATCSGTIGDW